MAGIKEESVLEEELLVGTFTSKPEGKGNSIISFLLFTLLFFVFMVLSLVCI